jgi:hypothetical protein
MLLIFISIFTDTTTSYSDKMLGAMKRGALLSMLFFILALVAGLGNNASRAVKAFGALIDVALLLHTVSVDPKTGQSAMLTEMTNFFKAPWAANTASTADTFTAATVTADGSGSGTQTPGTTLA